MSESIKITASNGKTWIVSKVRREEAEAKDFRFWYEGLTAEQRVDAVADALAGCLKTRGLDGVPRLRRVHRRVKRPRPTHYIGLEDLIRAKEAAGRLQDRADARVLRRAKGQVQLTKRSSRPRERRG